jgi:TonB family protein
MRQRAFSAVVILAVAITLASPLTPLGRIAKAGDTATGSGLSMGTPTRDYYPWKAKRQGITGRVGLECSVDEKGRVRNIVVLESGGPLLDDAAKKLLSDMRFTISPDWLATGGPTQRWRFGVIFRLVGNRMSLVSRTTVRPWSLPGFPGHKVCLTIVGAGREVSANVRFGAGNPDALTTGVGIPCASPNSSSPQLRPSRSPPPALQLGWR